MNLLKALMNVSSMTLVSRILGFVRDALIARLFGAGFATDAFFVAFRLPNLLRRIFAEGAFSQAFVPLLAEYRVKRGKTATQGLLDHVSGLLAVVLLAVSIIGMLAAPLIIRATAPGFASSPDKMALSVELLRLTFPYILFISLASLAGSILNAFNRFSIPAFTPTFLNISFIACAFWLAPYMNPPVMALGWAVFIGGVIQLVWQLPALKKIGMLPRPRLNLKDEAIWRLLTRMGQAIFAVSIAQISLLINTVFASFLVSGSVSWMYYADRLMEFPAGVIGVALGTILLPALSRAFASEDKTEYQTLLDWGLRLCLLLSVPSAVGLAVLATPLIGTLFQYGQFNALDLEMTQKALLAYSIGLPGLLFVKVLAPAFYSRQDLKTPMKAALWTLAATQIMNIILIEPLKHAGLSLSIGVAACLNAFLLYRALCVQNLFKPQPGWLIFTLNIIGASCMMAGACFLLADYLGSWSIGSMLGRLIRLSCVVLAGLGVYFGSLYLAGIRINDFIKKV